MIVLTLTDCPPRVRGDLSKWLCELSTGVYVGHVSARVRDEIWKRVCDQLKSGRATMVFTAQNEQGMDFRVHNTAWEPIDFDGLKLMLRPSPDRLRQKAAGAPKTGFSKAAKFRKVRAIAAAAQRVPQTERYVVIDIETTGLSEIDDEIIELAALRVSDHQAVDSFSSLVRPSLPLSPAVTRLTGITDDLLAAEGRPLADALKEFITFIGQDKIIAHNAPFDCAFLRTACRACGLPLLANQTLDTLSLARRKLDQLNSHKLTALAEHFGFGADGAHRSLRDCRLTLAPYNKLIEM